MPYGITCIISYVIYHIISHHITSYIISYIASNLIISYCIVSYHSISYYHKYLNSRHRDFFIGLVFLYFWYCHRKHGWPREPWFVLQQSDLHFSLLSRNRSHIADKRTSTEYVSIFFFTVTGFGHWLDIPEIYCWQRIVETSNKYYNARTVNLIFGFKLVWTYSAFE